MSSKKYLFTSESVTEGHPDKVCDQISDAILDNFLCKYPQARVAAETSVTTGMVLVSGEITAIAMLTFLTLSEKLSRTLDTLVNHQVVLMLRLVRF